MKIIGLCGQSGAGKTTALEIFMSHGFPCVNCDELARLVTKKGTACLNELQKFFGGAIIYPDGTLDRKALAEVAFSSKEKHAKLCEITHRHILLELENRIEAAREAGERVLVIDAPLLFESGLAAWCDEVVALCADRGVRLERIMRRDGLTEEEALARISRQKDERELAERSSFVIYNNNNKAELEKEINKLVRKIGENIE